MNIDDEILIRTEMSCMKERFLDLENLCKKMISDMQEINDKVLSSTTEFRSTTTSVLEKLKNTENVRPAHEMSDESAPNRIFASSWSVIARKTPNLSIPLKRSDATDTAQTSPQFVPLSPSDRRLHPSYCTPTTEATENIAGDWHTFKRRKRKPMVLGKGESSTVKGIKPVKIFSLFLTRCPPETRNHQRLTK